jgi:hypothetical protein
VLTTGSFHEDMIPTVSTSSRCTHGDMCTPGLLSCGCLCATTLC